MRHKFSVNVYFALNTVNSCQLFGCLKMFLPKLWKSGPCSGSCSGGNLTCHFELNTIVRKLWSKADTWRLERRGRWGTWGFAGERKWTSKNRYSARRRERGGSCNRREIIAMSLRLCLCLGDWDWVKWHQQCGEPSRTHVPKRHGIGDENYYIILNENLSFESEFKLHFSLFRVWKKMKIIFFDGQISVLIFKPMSADIFSIQFNANAYSWITWWHYNTATSVQLCLLFS